MYQKFQVHGYRVQGPTSAVPAQLGLAWPEAALAFSNTRPGQSHETQLGLGLAWPRPQLLYVKHGFFSYRCTNRIYYVCYSDHPCLHPQSVAHPRKTPQHLTALQGPSNPLQPCPLTLHHVPPIPMSMMVQVLKEQVMPDRTFDALEGLHDVTVRTRYFLPIIFLFYLHLFTFL
jgi:hypothetical protein